MAAPFLPVCIEPIVEAEPAPEEGGAHGGAVAGTAPRPVREEIPNARYYDLVLANQSKAEISQASYSP